ncbi:unnamed protein product [Polarella glacialis]|uniref:Uncharacterized protein n=1 Tax=Polarella glacialis TaxID=89957 RepID=A0A813FKD2_POLGL|nr:unnamed protein product [Polarella glacialis]
MCYASMPQLNGHEQSSNCSSGFPSCPSQADSLSHSRSPLTEGVHGNSEEALHIGGCCLTIAAFPVEVIVAMCLTCCCCLCFSFVYCDISYPSVMDGPCRLDAEVAIV